MRGMALAPLPGLPAEKFLMPARKALTIVGMARARLTKPPVATAPAPM